MFRQPNSTIPMIYDQLQAHGYIGRRAFSIWLNDITSTTGSLLFGGVDTTKYHGELVNVPVLLSANGEFTAWSISLTSVSRTTRIGTTHLTPANYNVSVVVDTGSPNMYLPWALYQAISSAMNVTMYEGFTYVSCGLRQSHDYLTFGLGGPKIDVPYPALIYPFGNPSNLGPVTGPDGTQLCYLGVIGTNGTIILLGDTFIRSAYIVFDVDYQRIAIAPAKTFVAEDNVVPLPSGTSLPGST